MSDKKIKEEKKDLQTIDMSMFNGLPTGFEDTCSDTYQIARLKILQDLSPEYKKGANHIEGAETGLFCNSTTKQLYKEINIIVLKVMHNLLAWKPERQGLAGIYAKEEEDKIIYRKDGLKKFDKEGNSIVDTISFFCINADKPLDIFIFPLSIAHFKYAQKFSSRLKNLEANNKPLPSFAGVWNITTVEDSNKKGTWFTIGVTPTFKRFITSDEFNSFVKPALEMLKKAKVDFSQFEDESVTVAEDEAKAY